MNPTIFREYDIRGIADEDITEKDTFLIGKAFGTYLKSHQCHKLTVGRDCRLTSLYFCENLIQGLLSSGCEVIDIGVCPTPVLYFSIHHLKQEGGIIVTASHNPPEYNGFKLCLGLDSVHGKELRLLHELIEHNNFIHGKGKVVKVDVRQAYQDFIINGISLSRSFRIGIDAGNGTAGVLAIPILNELGCEIHELYCDMDGRFPNHQADPTVAENMQDLIRLVLEHKLEVGIGYDGDGDRIGVVDEKGRIVYGDQLIILFARDILSRHPGATFISEVKCSKVMYDDIEKHGGKAIMWKTGHSLIKQKMKEEKALLAGEMSGHMFFADRYLGYDDAIYASCRLLEILANSQKTLSQLIDELPKTATTPEIRVECPEHIKFQLVEQVAAIFKKEYNVIDIDGVRIVFEDGWGLVRASNTQPVLVLRFEAMTESRLQEIRGLVESKVAEIKKTLTV
ncbi:MAG: phosphomannomutase/phosphoglucomutase [Desulfobacterales bacterium]|nr:phosphomannomutase/phosphoglucomutase [Desulfobacterales bacterium]